jgi:ABC-type phosphate transport system permease subunit
MRESFVNRAVALLIVIYMVLVIVFLIEDGRPFGPHYGWLLLLTLPWSIVAWWFTWALMHDGPQMFMLMFFVGALLNAAFAVRLLNRLRRSRIPAAVVTARDDGQVAK